MIKFRDFSDAVALFNNHFALFAAVVIVMATEPNAHYTARGSTVTANFIKLCNKYVNALMRCHSI